MIEQRFSTFVHKAHCGLASMSGLQREVFWAMRLEDGMKYTKLAERHGSTEPEVQRKFTGALYVLARAVREPDPWCWRLRPW